ncbi:MAG TPA: GNAT family N-acetyltransferase [Gemmatimonadaceae bacterium]|nr:GNAT family N-acetyltransferase [Gemmatimonadaceae bacterium]
MKTRPPRIVVRQAHDGDLDAVVAMRSALLEASRVNPAYRRLRRDFRDIVRPLFAAQLADERCLTLIATAGTQAVGVLRCTLSGNNPLYEPPRHAYVLSVYVLPPYRKRGVLTALLRHADVWCNAHGAEEMRLHCGIENRTGNAAWRALGFEAAEVLRVRRVPRRRPGRSASPGRLTAPVARDTA